MDRWKSKKLAQREEFSDDEESDKEDEVSEFEVPLKKIKAQKAPQKRLRIPKKLIREKSAVPRKWKQKQPPRLPSGPYKAKAKVRNKTISHFFKAVLVQVLKCNVTMHLPLLPTFSTIFKKIYI